jgi:hypothetical protein
MIDGVVAVVALLDDHRDSELFRDRFDARLIGRGQADEFGIEIRHIFGQLRGVSRLASTDTKITWGYRAFAARSRFSMAAKVVSVGAKVRAIRVAEKQHGPMPRRIGGVKGSTMLVDQAKIRHSAARAKIGPGANWTGRRVDAK